MLRFLSFMAVALAAGLCLPSQVDAQSSYGAHSYTVTRTRTVGPWRARLFERRQARRAASSHGTYGVMQSSGSQDGYGS